MAKLMLSSKIDPVAHAPAWIFDLCDCPLQEKATPINPPEMISEFAVGRAAYYLKNQAPLAIQGQGGDETTYKVAAFLKDYGVTQDVALNLMLDHWNDRCAPAWRQEDLRIKIENAYRYGQAPFGARAPETVFKKIESDPLGGNYTKSDHSSERLLVQPFHAIKYEFQRHYLIKFFIDLATIVLLVGHSAVGKTFVALNLAIHVALNLPWNGKRVRHGAVVYVSLEGPIGMRKRIEAIRQDLKLEETIKIPLGLISGTLDLRTSDDDVKLLIERIKEFGIAEGMPVVLVIVDTMAKALAGANENEFKEMSEGTKRAGRIRDETGAAVVFVHHFGKDDTKGPRGHSSLKGDWDTLISVKPGAIHVDKQKDEDKGRPIPFRLHRIIIGKDEDGEDISSCVVRFDNSTEDFQTMPRDLKPGSQNALAYSALVSLGAVNGNFVHIEEWRQALKDGDFKSLKPQSLSKAFGRVREELGRFGLTEQQGATVTALWVDES